MRGLRVSVAVLLVGALWGCDGGGGTVGGGQAPPDYVSPWSDSGETPTPAEQNLEVARFALTAAQGCEEVTAVGCTIPRRYASRMSGALDSREGRG